MKQNQRGVSLELVLKMAEVSQDPSTSSAEGEIGEFAKSKVSGYWLRVQAKCLRLFLFNKYAILSY
jgi:hypothetical protein